MQMSHYQGQSPLKVLLNNFGKCNKTHGMTVRCGNQTVIHDDSKDAPASQDTAPLDNTPPNCSMSKQDSESPTEYSKGPDSHHDLAELQKHFQQLQEWLTPNGTYHQLTHTNTHTEELAQLTDKLQHLTTTPQPCPPLRPIEEPLLMAMQKYTDTICVTQLQTNLTTSLLQDISTFDGEDSTKLEDWLTHLKTADDVLKESQTHWAKTKSCRVTCTLIHEAPKAEKYWDDIKGILCLKLYNSNIHKHITFHGNPTKG